MPAIRKVKDMTAMHGRAERAPQRWLAALSRAAIKTCRSFAANKTGSVASTFGLTLIPIMLSAGAAVDYSLANKAKAQFDAAADAAALAAVNKSAMNTPDAAAKTTALNVFNSYASTVRLATLNTVTATITASMSRTAVVSYSATVPTTLLAAVGIKNLTVNGSSTATSAVATYIDFYLLLDNTPSMGVGATTADINTMVGNTPDQCAFACHDISTSPNDYYGLAKRFGVQMRIDVMRQATQRLMDTADTSQLVANQYRAAIYTFGSSATNTGLTRVHPLSSNLNSAKSNASNIDLMTVPYQNYAGDTETDFDDVLTDLNKEISTPGDGSSFQKPQKTVFFVSDGVNDSVSATCSQPTTTSQDPQTKKNYTRCQAPLNTSTCKTMKDRGIKIAVLYTTYLPLPTNPWYNNWIKPFSNQIATNMQNCASPDLYFEVSPTQGISDAMIALFQKAVQGARLTK